MKLNKPYSNKQYADFAVYCNRNGLIIEEKGYCLEAVNPPEKSVEQKQAEVRAIRNQYLADTDKYVSIPDFPITETEEALYVQYRKYLRDYPESSAGWYLTEPLSYGQYMLSNS